MQLLSGKVSIGRANLLMRMLAVCALLCASGAGASAEPAPLEPSSALLMTINGRTVRQGDMDTMMQINFGPKFSGLTPAEQETLRINRASETRVQLIDRALLVTAAVAAGLSASPEEIAAQMKDFKRQLPAGLTMDGYLEGIGVPLATFHEHVKDQVLINKLSALRTADIENPTAAEIEIYYRQNPDYFAQKERARVSHVLISTQDAITDEQRASKRAEAEVVRRRLMAAGPDAFAAVASEVSNCPSKAQGGDLGMIEKGAMVPAFDAAAFTQEIGAIGRVVRSPKGYHVLKVTERIPAKQVSVEDASDDIEAMLLYRGRDQAMQGYLQTLRLSAKVIVPQP